MIQLNVQQKNALYMLRNAIDELQHVSDDELSQVLEDLGFLPERDLTEMSAELGYCVERGEIGTREELLNGYNG